MLLVSFPAQGHVAALMKLAHRLADCRVKVTFVTTEFICERIKESQQLGSFSQMEDAQHLVRIVPLPDGLEPEDDRKAETKMTRSISRVMPGYLKELIQKINQQEDDKKITCVIADVTFGWALQVAAKLGLKKASVYTSAPGILAMIMNIPKFIKAGIISSDGIVRKNEKVELSPNLPAASPAEFLWSCPGNPSLQTSMFQYINVIRQNIEASDRILCTWFYELAPSANKILPNIVPVGPLIANGQPTGNFWSEDLTCLSWLDKQPPGSVIYAAFGSISKLSQQQFNELALGLELAGQPFLCVVRPGFINGSSTDNHDGFVAKVADFGKMVKWAPQEKVLAHRSVACSLTHCGWNSTMEGISMGVPFLCWPYGHDHLYIKSCICDDWKVGLWLEPDDNGIISRHEIKRKVDELLSNDVVRKNALKLKELAQKSVAEGGSSSKNLEYFIKQITE